MANALATSSAKPALPDSGQEIVTWLPDAEIVSVGAPCVSTAAMMLQKPPSSAKSPPLIEPASTWPMVAESSKSLLLLWPPPPEIAEASRVKSCAEQVKIVAAQAI